MGPELLLPVGSLEMALAAIHNGADAIYVGFPGYNARGRSKDFEVQELREIIETCHLHGVKTNLAFNVVMFEDELEKVIPDLAEILPLKPDALIVQDLGIAKLVRRMAPEQVIHASTQMTITNPDAIALLEDLGIRRFVLGRENSLKEIELIREKTDKELEVFVHGALCVSYSGQCFTSESIGGRSANRGQCAQSCRFGYEMFVDGQKKDLVDRQYLVSPRDLCGIEEIPALMDLGVASFKIEGRLKSPEYVAASAQEYREAIDRHAAGRDLSPAEAQAARKRMSTTYSRGFFTGWLHGVNHQKLVDGDGKSHRGFLIGRIADLDRNRLLAELETETELSPGDGILWSYWKDGAQIEGGAQIYSAKRLGRGRYELRFDKEITLNPELAGAKLFMTSVAAQKRELKRTFHDKTAFKRIPLDLKVKASPGKPLEVTATDGRFTAQARGKSLVEPARNRAVTDEFLGEELGALSGTAFTLGALTVEREVPFFYSHKELKELRRELTAELTQLRSGNRVERPDGTVATTQETISWLRASRSSASSAKTRLNVILREKDQVSDVAEAVKDGRIERESLHAVILDFEFGMDYEPSIALLREAGIRSGIATTRILKPKEYTHFTRIERIKPDVILIRNLGALRYFTEVKPISSELRGDFSLNVTNHLTADYLLAKGLASVTASYDMSSAQLADLLQATDASKLEITAHQYMPSFHMEHCVFAAFLSQGSSFRDCGKPCERHRVELKDQFGNRHEIKADPECRNTMYNALPQSAARFIESWRKQGLGPGMIRYEALYERGSELIAKIAGYQDLLAGRKDSREVVSQLKLMERYGLGEGAFSR